MRWVVLCLGLSMALADNSLPAGPPCKSVGDCWLDEEGHAISRPKKLRGRPIPRGDCGSKLLWLRHRLACIDERCVAVNVGDRC
jgi:hypothetical protein